MMMNRKNLFWASFSITAAFLMIACGKEQNVQETPAETLDNTPTAVVIPYTVAVGNEGPTTRATLGDDVNRTLYFAEGDELYITGNQIQGVLSLKEGDAGKSGGATFSGDLYYTGEGSPADDLELTATLVSAQQKGTTKISVDGAGAVTVNYPNNVYCTDVYEAVKQYSNLTGKSTYSAKAFSLSQHTTFLNFVITFEDGTAANTGIPAVVRNNGADIASADVVTTTEDAKVVAKFVLPIKDGATLVGANVKMGDKDVLTFSSSTALIGKV